MVLNWKIPPVCSLPRTVFWVPASVGAGVLTGATRGAGQCPAEAPCRHTLPLPASLVQPGHAPEPVPGQRIRHPTLEEKEESDT